MSRKKCDTIYFIRAGGKHGPIKIGMTSDVLRRACQLQTAHHAQIAIIATVPISEARGVTEEALHRQFSADRIGREWFRGSRELATLIEKIGTPWIGRQPELKTERVAAEPVTPVEHKPTVLNALREIVKADCRSNRDIAKAAGIHEVSFSTFLSGRRGLSLETAWNLSVALGCPLRLEAVSSPSKRARPT